MTQGVSRYTAIVCTSMTQRPFAHLQSRARSVGRLASGHVIMPSIPNPFVRIKAHPPHAAPGQVIGLLGGSFNPPHAAHRMISEVALKRLGLDKVWWIVSPGNPLKSRVEQTPLSERLILCRSMAMNPRIEVTDFEASLPTPYTASTIAFLKTRSPLVRFVWIMGADNLASFDRWERWREIFTTVPIVVVDRPGWRMKALASKAARAFAAHRVPEIDARALGQLPPPAWTFLTGPLSQLSSTTLRRKARVRGEFVAKKAHAPPVPPWK
jgi:nicotinate-nucleotide adenylyltransferase